MTVKVIENGAKLFTLTVTITMQSSKESVQKHPIEGKQFRSFSFFL